LRIGSQIDAKEVELGHPKNDGVKTSNITAQKGKCSGTESSNEKKNLGQ